MKIKLPLLALVTLFLFAVSSAYGQNGKLTIKNNRRYYVGEVQISRAEALALAAPYADVAKHIKMGVNMKWSAVGLGIAGPVVTYVGLNGIIFSAMGGSPRSSINAWKVTMITGGVMTYAAIGLAIGSGVAQRKAMRLYNDYDRLGEYGAEHRSMYLSLAPTIGGLGLQLRF
jgi:hypothetical protein